MKTLAFAVVVMLSAVNQTVASDELTGEYRIVDGDTLWINDTKVRLHGIDAPEMRQECRRENVSYPCGEASTDALRALISNQPIRCEGSIHDRYGRLIAVCYAGTYNLNEEMVRQGWALAYRRYSEDYVLAESEAQLAKRGIWAGEFKAPWEWRRK